MFASIASFASLSRALHRHDSGNVAMIFALAVTATTIMVAMALDYRQVLTTRSAMQAAADAAVLAVVSQGPDLSASARERMADNIFVTNFPGANGDALVQGTNLSQIEGGFRYTFQQSVPTQMMRAFGTESVAVAVTADAVTKRRYHEFVVAIDTTNSMLFSPADYTAARNAMKRLVDQFYAGATRAGDVVGTVMPWADRVTIGDRARSFANGTSPSGWDGCLDERLEPTLANPFRQTDAPPTGANSFDYFVDVDKPTHPTVGSGTNRISCEASEITGPERRDPDILKRAIDNLHIQGTGRPDEAMAWAWRLLSPRWHGRWGAANYPRRDADVGKTIVFVTDGRMTIYETEVLPVDGSYDGYGWNQGSQTGFEAMVANCEGARHAGIDIHVVALSGNPHATAYLQRCASPGAFYTVGNIGEYEQALRVIGSKAAYVHLTR